MQTGAWMDRAQLHLQNILTEHAQRSMDLTVDTWIHDNKITAVTDLAKF